MGVNSAFVYRLYQNKARLGKTQGFLSEETPEDDSTRFMIIQFKRYYEVKLPKIITNVKLKYLK